MMFEESVLTLQSPENPGESTLSEDISIMDRFRQATIIVAQDQSRNLYLTTRDIILVERAQKHTLQWLRPLGERFTCADALALPGGEEYGERESFVVDAASLFAQIENDFLSEADRQILAALELELRAQHSHERDEPDWLLYEYLYLQVFSPL